MSTSRQTRRSGGGHRTGFHSIAVDVDDRGASSDRVYAAIDLVKRFQGCLIGLYRLAGTSVSALADAFISASDLRKVEQAYQERAEATRHRFEQSAAEAEVMCEWHTYELRRGEALAHFSVYADLMVVGQDDSDQNVGQHSCEQLVVESACPVLVLPNRRIDGRLGKHVMIGWNGSREAARAVAAAMPLLQRARKVEVVSIGEPCIAPRDVHPAHHALVDHLERHGVPAVARDLTRQERAIDEALFAEAQDEGADLIVLGAYSHQRLREIFLGGVTQNMLRHSKLPIVTIH